MVGVCLKSVLSSSSRAYIAANFGLLTLSNVVALVVGLLALKFLFSFLKRRNALPVFGYYRVILGSLILIFTLII